MLRWVISAIQWRGFPVKKIDDSILINLFCQLAILNEKIIHELAFIADDELTSIFINSIKNNSLFCKRMMELRGECANE